MFKKFYFLLSIFLVNSICCTAVNGEDKSAQGQPQLFTNQDIEKYKGPSDTITTDTKTALREDREKVRNDKKQSIREDQEKEYWCKKASVYNKEIKKAEKDVKEAEKKISEESSKSHRAGKKTVPSQKKLERARERVEDARADLGELEDEAHRKDVPPGWLRCQFE